MLICNHNIQSQSKWTSLMHEQCENVSYYHKKFLEKFSRKIHDYDLHTWPLNIYVPDIVIVMHLLKKITLYTLGCGS